MSHNRRELLERVITTLSEGTVGQLALVFGKETPGATTFLEFDTFTEFLN